MTKLILRSKYENTKSIIQIGQSYTKAFKTTLGTLQGDITSPIIFNLVFNTLSKEFETLDNQIKFMDINEYRNQASYADDIVGIAGTEKTLQTLYQKEENI